GAGIDTTTSATTGTFSGGGETWVTASINVDGDGNYHLQIAGNATGTGYDINFYQASSATGYSNGGILGASGWIGSLSSYDEESTTEWVQTNNASGSSSFFSDAGRNILTQSAAQAALAQLDTAINAKDTARASLGALQNRLENTITQVTIQAENLQAAESRISDVDVALEMTEFTKNMILAQAATSMLAQANGLAQLALSVLG
ncbi:MAG: flagellin, partial [Deltaproteobacteria bacterium]|nr:flagellin [Deltaproteobacteria bacterium]